VVEHAVAGHGDGRLSGLTVENRTSGATETVPATALFVLIGAEPHTGWLCGTIRWDRRWFVLTGDDLLQDGRPPAGRQAGAATSATWRMSHHPRNRMLRGVPPPIQEA